MAVSESSSSVRQSAAHSGAEVTGSNPVWTTGSAPDTASSVSVHGAGVRLLGHGEHRGWDSSRGTVKSSEAGKQLASPM